MNKAQIEKLRKVNSGKVAVAAEVPRQATSASLTDDDRRLLAAFYAARLASRDYDRSFVNSKRKLASLAFSEAVAALQVWRREMAKGCQSLSESDSDADCEVVE